ncbi:PLDc N-terminal domain-containing protein [Halosolutus halophilus]|uniref:PLDc N-terminal domain-containing protein n=1 Tax=Halosolutus halophilus TaxID=1552990 RepID=UPI0022350F55|nr:PLDc N-terminal domain-containing protein [Halosolutus halophilus]
MVPTIILQGSGGGAAALIFLLFLFAFIALTVWVYVDAESNSNHPAFLWALVVFMAPLLGLVLYFLLGRNVR